MDAGRRLVQNHVTPKGESIPHVLTDTANFRNVARDSIWKGVGSMSLSGVKTGAGTSSSLAKHSDDDQESRVDVFQSGFGCFLPYITATRLPRCTLKGHP